MGISRKAKRELFWIVLLLGSLSFSGYILVGDGGYLKLRDFREQLADLQAENRRLKEAQATLHERIDRFRHDPREIERLARERYQLALPGDIIVNVH